MVRYLFLLKLDFHTNVLIDKKTCLLRWKEEVFGNTQRRKALEMLLVEAQVNLGKRKMRNELNILEE